MVAIDKIVRGATPPIDGKSLWLNTNDNSIYDVDDNGDWVRTGGTWAKIQTLTQAEYDDIVTKDSNTIYIISDAS